MQPPGFPSPSDSNAGHAAVLLAKAAAPSRSPLTYSLAGRLHRSRSGWLVLSVPAALIRGAFDAVDRPGYELPPDLGIPVMSVAELSRVGPERVSERGHQFPYSLGSLHEYQPSNSAYASVVAFHVHSPALRQVRVSYGLPPYPGAAGFRLPVAVRRYGVLHDNGVSKSGGDATDEVDWEAVRMACGT